MMPPQKLYVVPMFMVATADTEGDVDKRVSALQALALKHGFSLYQDEVLPITPLAGDPDDHEIHTVVDHAPPLQNTLTLLLEIEACLRGKFTPGDGTRLEAAMKMAKLARASLYGIEANAAGDSVPPGATLTLTTADDCIGIGRIEATPDGAIEHSPMVWDRSPDMETVSAVVRRGDETLTLSGDQWRELEDQSGDVFWNALLIENRPLNEDILASNRPARLR